MVRFLMLTLTAALQAGDRSVVAAIRAAVRRFRGSVLIGLLAIALGLWPMAAEANPIRVLEEAPGQMVSQVREPVVDGEGRRWQVVAFQRRTPQGLQPLALRLVGFPGQVTFVRGEMLILEDALGDRWQAADDSVHIFTDVDSPEPHIGQYRIGDLWTQLPDAIPLTLQVPTVAGTVPLSVGPGTVADWKALARSMTDAESGG